MPVMARSLASVGACGICMDGWRSGRCAGCLRGDGCRRDGNDAAGRAAGRCAEAADAAAATVAAAADAAAAVAVFVTAVASAATAAVAAVFSAFFASRRLFCILCLLLVEVWVDTPLLLSPLICSLPRLFLLAERESCRRHAMPPTPATASDLYDAAYDALRKAYDAYDAYDAMHVQHCENAASPEKRPASAAGSGA